MSTAIDHDRRIRATPALILRIAVGVLVLVAVGSRVDPGELSVEWSARTVLGLGVVLGLLALAQVLGALRWLLVLGDPAVPFAYLCRIYLVGVFFSLFLPTSVGGDAVRAVAVSRAARRPVWAVSSVVIERLLGMVALVGVLAAGALAAPAAFTELAGRASLGRLPTGAQGGAMLLAVTLGALALVLLARRSAAGRRVLGEGAALWKSVRDRPRAFAAALGVSVLVQTTYVLVWSALAASLGLEVPAAEFLVFVPFVSLAAMLPVTISGLGVREGAWILLLAPYGISAADAVAFSLLYFVALLVIGAAGGVSFTLRGLGLGDGAPARMPAARSITSSRTAESLSQL